MISKTTCQHCEQHIEFDVEAAGQFVACPTCGKQTRLLLPNLAGIGKPTPPAKSKALGWKEALGCFLVGGMIIAIVVKIVIDNPEAPAIFGGTAAAIIGGVLGGILTVLWLAFPVFVYFGIKRICRLLEQIRDK